MNSVLKSWLIVNQIDQITPFIYIVKNGEVSHLFRGSKVIGDMKYLMRSVKRTADAVGIWNEDNQDVKRVNSLYAIVSGRFSFKINKRYYLLSL